MPEVIPDQHKLPTGFYSYAFKFAVNPRTRVPQSSAFKDRALYDRIKDLPRWEQTQELDPCFRSMDVTIAYLKDVEMLTFPWDPNNANIDPQQGIALHLYHMGLPADLVFQQRFIFNSCHTTSTQLPKWLTIVKKHAPQRRGIAAPIGLSQIPFRLPGPLPQEFTVVNQIIPIGLSPKGNKTTDIICTIAKIEFSYDLRARKSLIAQTWARLRLLDPSLFPWGVDETIASKNP
jgi:hypothetical protein